MRHIIVISITLLIAASCGVHRAVVSNDNPGEEESPRKVGDGKPALDIWANTLAPNIIVLKEFYCHDSYVFTDLQFSPWVHNLAAHPNSVNGDYIILNSTIKASNTPKTYSEHIAEYDYDEYGLWYTKTDTLVFKPLAYAIGKGDKSIVILEDAKEKLFWLYEDYLYEVTEYPIYVDDEVTFRKKIYDTVPSEYLNARSQLADGEWQRIFKVMLNKELLIEIMNETSNQISDK